MRRTLRGPRLFIALAARRQWPRWPTALRPSARVQKVFGPGNAYVTAAKRLVVGHVAINLLSGPSELLVLADDTAPPEAIAADLLAQAEHGSGHERVWLLTTSARLLEAVQRQLARQTPGSLQA